MANEPEGYFIAAEDWPDFRLLINAFRANGRLLNRPQYVEPRRERPGDQWKFGKLDQSVTAGVLSAAETFTVWKGPAWGTDDVAVGDPIKCQYATDDMASGTYIIATLKGGKWYVSPFSCGGEAPA